MFIRTRPLHTWFSLFLVSLGIRILTTVNNTALNVFCIKMCPHFTLCPWIPRNGITRTEVWTILRFLKHIATLAQNVLKWNWGPRPGNVWSCILMLIHPVTLGLSFNLSSVSVSKLYLLYLTRLFGENSFVLQASLWYIFSIINIWIRKISYCKNPRREGTACLVSISRTSSTVIFIFLFFIFYSYF